MEGGLSALHFSPLCLVRVWPEHPDLGGADKMRRGPALDLEEGRMCAITCPLASCLIPRDTGQATHSSPSPVCRLAGCLPCVCHWPAGRPRASVLPPPLSFFHMQNAGSCWPLHPEGATGPCGPGLHERPSPHSQEETERDILPKGTPVSNSTTPVAKKKGRTFLGGGENFRCRH